MNLVQELSVSRRAELEDEVPFLLAHLCLRTVEDDVKVEVVELSAHPNPTEYLLEFFCPGAAVDIPKVLALSPPEVVCSANVGQLFFDGNSIDDLCLVGMNRRLLRESVIFWAL